MPRYFFHLHDGDELRDKKGTELADLRAAKIFATRCLGELLTHDPEHVLTGKFSVSVSSHENDTLFEVAVLAMTVPAGPLN